jgi:hypothetical protein
MAKVVTLSGKNVTPKGQPTRNTCWLTAYEMLFNGAGFLDINQSTIEEMLYAGGFTDIATAKSRGLLDSDMQRTGMALNLGWMHPSALMTIGGVARSLQQHGVLWVALQIPKDENQPDGERFPHVVIVFGVDEAAKRVGIVNPWKQNYYDTPSKTWMDWKWFLSSVKYTQSASAGCQYFQLY